MKKEDQERLSGAIGTMREIEAELEMLSGRTDQESRERQVELIDELMTLDMGIGPLRKQFATQRRDKGESGT